MATESEQVRILRENELLKAQLTNCEGFLTQADLDLEQAQARVKRLEARVHQVEEASVVMREALEQFEETHGPSAVVATVRSILKHIIDTALAEGDADAT